METIGLFFKTFWSPAESMFLLSKKPRVLLPLIIVAVLQLGVGFVSLSRLDFGQSMGLRLRTTAVVIPYLFFSLVFAGLRMLQTG